MKKIVIVGGTFDPIHNGHIYIAYEAYKKLGLDEVIFMPNGNPPHKRGKNITDDKIRCDMIKKAIAPYSFFAINYYEIEKQGLSFTYETLKYLKQSLGEVELYFITGADCLIDLHLWKNVDQIMKYCNFVVFNRPGFSKESILKEKIKVEKKYNTNIIFLDLLELDISSSLIRERIKNGLEVRFFIPEDVLSIIQRENLYLKEK